MFTLLKKAGIFMAAAGVISLAALATTNTANAQSPTDVTTTDPNFITLEITPVCSNNVTKMAYWKVVNKNSRSDLVTWTNFDNSTTGTFTAQPGESSLVTGYDQAAGNNRTGFVWTNNVSSTNAASTPCETPVTPTPPTPVVCIDGRIQQNLVVSYTAPNRVVVNTLNNQPLCDDVTIYFSSYIMPANYNGQGFYNNPTAYPQTLFSSQMALLKKDTDGTVSLNIELPHSCNNIQTDVYYGPEITVVGANGHGTQNIDSKIYLSTGSCDQGNGNGGGTTPPVTPTPTPTPEVPAEQGNGMVNMPPAELPAELPETGATGNKLPWASLLTALLLGITTYGATLAIQTVRRK